MVFGFLFGLSCFVLAEPALHTREKTVLLVVAGVGISVSNSCRRLASC